MMSFYVWLAVVNVLCFLPLYLLNFREQPNPLGYFFQDRYFNQNKLKGLYHRLTFTDPFHINFDWTFFVLVCAWLDLRNPFTVAIATALLGFSFIEIFYTSIMQTIFKRPPDIRSDLSLAATGLTIAQNRRALVLAGVLLMVVVIVVLAFVASDALLARAPTGHWSVPLIALGLLPPCLYRWSTYRYSFYLSRTVYSSILHFYLNLRLARRFDRLLQQSEASFKAHNYFSDLKFTRRPNVVTLCIESYGNVVYTNPDIYAEIAPLVTEFDDSLAEMGLSVASNYSEAPLFAGGSWLSYTSFAYGTKIDDVHLYRALFAEKSPFAAYESLFHVLKKNGYRNQLLCPMGGIDPRDVNWENLRRCFQADAMLDYESLEFAGRPIAFMGQDHAPCAPDEYALNHAYEASRSEAATPFSLFFCTLNSHYPYHSPLSAAKDWRDLNDPATGHTMARDVYRSITQRYAAAMRYQLEFILRFIERNRDDDVIVTLFGDHQPPRVARQSDGAATPVHVICRDERLVAEFLQHGFVPRFDLAGGDASAVRRSQGQASHEHASSDQPGPVRPSPIRHEAFLSILMRAMNRSFGEAPEKDIPFQPDGARVLSVQ